ncbi:hypothetical protein LXA43DRAFT_595100 [Ganoderma leucocontextum]|nr:hypothetical protein LXA43DRAFT_595100 [Ganoderma leucocontextum]
MWLLNTKTLELREFHTVPRGDYAILSHVWQPEDKTYNFQSIRDIYEKFRDSEDSRGGCRSCPRQRAHILQPGGRRRESSVTLQGFGYSFHSRVERESERYVPRSLVVAVQLPVRLARPGPCLPGP